MSYTTEGGFCPEVVEKKFRDARIISLPENLQNTKGKRPDISSMRVVLQNWWNPENISENAVKRKTVHNYRYMVTQYLKGNDRYISSKQIPLVEEYRDYITTEPEGYEPLKECINKKSKRQVKIKEKVVMNTKETNNIPITMEFIKYIKDLGVKEFTLRF